jgi:phosphotriesterase-related protein
MNKGELRGKAQTVLGLIGPEQLGITLPHEHILVDGRMYFMEPRGLSDKKRAYDPITLENLNWVLHHIYNSYDNLLLNDENLAIKELIFFKNAGGNTVVDLTPQSIGRDPDALLRISRATGLNIIMGTAYYSEASYSKGDMGERSEEEISEEFVRDLLEGTGFFQVRAGMIGELGCTWPLKKNEQKVLVAGAIAQQKTGASINIHPGRNEKAPGEIIHILKESGADLSRTVISHMDRCSYLRESRIQMLEAGCFIEYDIFGTYGYYPAEVAVPEGKLPDQLNDTQRIREIMELIKLGWLNKILISHDVGFKFRLQTYGGPGYAHILNHAVPMMKVYGVPDHQIKTILIENPKSILVFK